MKPTSAILFLASALVGTGSACVTIVSEGPPIVVCSIAPYGYRMPTNLFIFRRHRRRAHLTSNYQGPLVSSIHVRNWNRIVNAMDSTGQQATLTVSGLQKGWNFSNGGLGSPKYCTGEWLNIVAGTKPWKKLSASSIAFS